MEITWYASNDLKNPACGDGSWDPNNNNHIGGASPHAFPPCPSRPRCRC
jgi:hypothetical protein